MSSIDITCSQVSVSSTAGSEVTVYLEYIDETEILEGLGTSYISEYASNNCLEDVVDNADANEILNMFDWETIKNHFKVDIIDELYGVEDEVLEKIGWSNIISHFKDNIDSLASEIAEDIVERQVE